MPVSTPSHALPDSAYMLDHAPAEAFAYMDEAWAAESNGFFGTYLLQDTHCPYSGEYVLCCNCPAHGGELFPPAHCEARARNEAILPQGQEMESSIATVTSAGHRTVLLQNSATVADLHGVTMLSRPPHPLPDDTSPSVLPSDPADAELRTNAFAPAPAMSTPVASSDNGSDNDNDAYGQPDLSKCKAFAKIVFPDGDYYVVTHLIILGRNMQMWDEMLEKEAQERRARKELDIYRKEPSQPSQFGIEQQPADYTTSSQPLRGRPAPPSNFSEHGGTVWYHPASNDELGTSRKRRRPSQFSKSSSTTSVAPGNLYTNPHEAADFHTFARVPIHSKNPDDLKHISKDHLHIYFNFLLERWEAKITGNKAFINDTLYLQGTVVPLEDNDDIIITTLLMTFKLPNNIGESPGGSCGTFPQESDDELLSQEESDVEASPIAPLSTSPVRRPSDSREAGDCDSGREDEDGQAPAPASDKPKQSKIKLKNISNTKAKPPKAKVKESISKPKKSVKKESPSHTSPLEAVVPLHKEHKLKAATNTEAEASQEPASPPPPPAAPFIKPGSVLEGIPLEELPEKRKGPGRPPKEGNVSKRDTQLANKKRKEFEKRGEEPPPFKELVNLVRLESKLKDSQNKLEANVQLDPGQQVRPSTEGKDGRAATLVGNEVVEGGVAIDTAKRASPKPPKKVREMSPVKPEAECTAEELKKPDLTYVHLIDQVLSEHPTGTADLQEIYELIMKKWPYYKYRTPTNGWQSSVRHNLLQSNRFVEAGKSGKGKFWTIDPNSPLEKEKRKRSPQPRNQVVNAPYPMGQGQASGHSIPYAQQQPNGPLAVGAPPGNYFASYPQPGYAPQANGATQLMGYGPGAGQPYQQHVGNSNSLVRQTTPTPWQMLIQEIVRFNERHCAQFAGDVAEQQKQKRNLEAIIAFLSDCYEGKTPEESSTDSVRRSDARVAFGGLQEIFIRHRPNIQISDPWSSVAGRGQPAKVEEDAAPAALGEARAVLTSGHAGEQGTAEVVEEEAAPVAAQANTASSIKRAVEEDGEEREAKKMRAD